MTIECVTLGTIHLFPGNPIAEQHQLRHRTIIQRQSWEVPQYKGMEFDEYDNPATIYLVWRDENLIARGVSRLYPTDRPFMLSEKFPHMASTKIPSGSNVLEGSRFCIDNRLPADIRSQISKELIIAYLEYCLDNSIDYVVGIMYPAYWRSLFIKNGWNPTWLGDVERTPDGKRSRAGFVHATRKVLGDLRGKAKIEKPVLTYGLQYLNKASIAA